MDPVAYVLPSASSRTMCIPPAPGALSTPAKTWRNCGVSGSSSPAESYTRAIEFSAFAPSVTNSRSTPRLPEYA